jgi:uncharacterized protein YceH (UPF0502 family)
MDEQRNVLNEVEVRVLGALIEKEATTPDYYPLSFNALLNACNQKSNRDPVMSLDEGAVREALESLHGKGLAGPASGADSRVAKYEHRVYETLKLSRPEVALLCELLLRGPQTPGELRNHAERMYRFESIENVLATLRRLIDREPPLVRMLARQPGTKESRYMHLLAGKTAGTIAEHEPNDTGRSQPADRLAELESRVGRLTGEVEQLKQEVAELRNSGGGEGKPIAIPEQG